MNNLIVSSLSGRGSKGKGREGKGREFKRETARVLLTRPLFLLTNKIELLMSAPYGLTTLVYPMQLICRFACSSALMKKDVPSSRGFFP